MLGRLQDAAAFESYPLQELPHIHSTNSPFLRMSRPRDRRHGRSMAQVAVEEAKDCFMLLGDPLFMQQLYSQEQPKR